ncbi:MAG TPA: hypothetical protein VD884_07535 [Ohtaekwangia sp.]|nr:hypothetical protein [Ohtaekwangia sp.]
MSENTSKQDPIGRGDKPSGRQAADESQHTGHGEQAPSTLHQGQGPDFQTQDQTIRQKNRGAKNLEEPNEPEKNPEELPTREPGKKPYIGDNPDEIKKKGPKL